MRKAIFKNGWRTDNENFAGFELEEKDMAVFRREVIESFMKGTCFNK